jgi:hypothetical protein
MSDRGTIHVNKALTTVAAGYKNADFIWNRVLPAIPVDKETDLYYEFGQEFLRYYGEKRADKTPARRIDSYSASTKTYICEVHSYKDLVSDRERSKADPIIQPDKRVLQNVARIVDMDIEQDVAAQVQATGNYTGMNADPDVNWNANEAGSDPIGDVLAKKDLVQNEIGVEPNIMIINKSVFNQLKVHPQLLDYYKYTGVPVLTTELIAKAFELQEIIVGKAIAITSKPGQTITKSKIWASNHASLLYRTSSPAMEEPSWGYTFMHKLFGGMTAKAKKWRDEDLAGDYIEVTRSYDIKVTGQKAGYLLTNVLG